MLGLQFSCLPWVAWWPWWSLWWLVGPPSCPLPAVWNRKLVNKMSYWIRNIDHLSFLIPSHRVFIQSLNRVKTFVRTVERRTQEEKQQRKKLKLMLQRLRWTGNFSLSHKSMCQTNWGWTRDEGEECSYGWGRMARYNMLWWHWMRQPTRHRHPDIWAANDCLKERPKFFLIQYRV